MFSHTTKACQQLVAESAIPLLLNVAIYESEKIVKPLSIEAITQIFRICAHVCAAPKLSISETWAHSIVNVRRFYSFSTLLWYCRIVFFLASYSRSPSTALRRAPGARTN